MQISPNSNARRPAQWIERHTLTTRLFSFTLSALLALLWISFLPASAATLEEFRFTLPEPAHAGPTALPAGACTARLTGRDAATPLILLESDTGLRNFVPVLMAGHAASGKPGVTLERVNGSLRLAAFQFEDLPSAYEVIAYR